MPPPMSLELQQKATQNFKQLQRLIMSRQMQQAIHLLQMPVMELAPAIEMELQQNPILEYIQEEDIGSPQNQEIEEDAEDESDSGDNMEKELKFDENDFEVMRKLDEDFRDYFLESGEYSHRRDSEQAKLQTFLESSICSETTLFEHLMRQAAETFSDKADLVLAEAIIGNLDENGFLKVPLKEIATIQKASLKKVESILKMIQTFHPQGVGAHDIKESLLIQLSAQNKKKTLSYEIIDKHFDDLLHNRIPLIKKNLKCSSKELMDAIEGHIAKLDLHPGAKLSKQITRYIVPDVVLRQEGDDLIVEVSDDCMPPLRLNSRYLRMLDDENLPQETKDFIRQKIVSAKWLLRNILQRNDTLERIASSIAKRHKEFFLNPEGKLMPLTMKTVAEELHLHESTIARAVANKYIDTPRGLLPLRFFFTNALETNEGEDISSKTVRDMLQEIIADENKKHPYSDAAISAMIKAKGIHCARRTVAKYRSLLNIGNAQQRKKFN